ncbi:xanthine dehydrogenase family protein molybdopterin-binding subunit [Halovulum dunhuangense]|uniref:Xanthine dehydrogenase family protein molybdopterin-binding subunit n=1 Tax=Halovulum dunhuangense TaxID=1505036 RepID=A0A849L516_9RHOB|nr:xanthine dehydrogenase family protein molybdopterin-binding subunit [Halovulum dunhuangense]NNU81353.1 xanthine dehydrogenase family protein molybdopterin-binding subunit [Halovulum dunhuangense]
MKQFGIHQPAKRREDVRFLTGAGRYIDDIAPEGALHMAFFRAPVAHGVITALDVSGARAVPGVVAVYTAADLEGKLENAMDFGTLALPGGGRGAAPRRPMLAEDRVRFAGEAIAAVVAETRAAALDGVEAILAEFDSLPVHLETAVGGPTIHPEAPDNLAYDWHYGDAEATDAAFAAAARTVRLELVDNRIICNAMEPRGCFSEMVDGRLHHAVNGQGVWGTRDALAGKLGMDPADVRVTTPDVGGGFGMKGMDYPEQFVVSFAARELDRPVRWMAERGESMLTDNGGRDVVTVAEAAFDADHRLQAVRIQSVSNLGAYNSAEGQSIQSKLALKVVTGVYDVQVGFFGVKGVYTNTTQIDAYRGAGRPEAIYVIERLMDTSARELGVDPIELRRLNFVKREQFPYRSFSGETYDVGDFNRVLDRAIQEADVAGFAARRAESARRGKLRGLGLSFYIESILGAKNESTKIEFAEDGMVNLYAGTQSNGQGHETVFAQMLHERAGIPFEKIRYIQGDSDLIAHGGGTGGSRSGTTQGNSINATSDLMIRKFKALAEEELEVASPDIVFEDGVFSVAGTDRSIGLMDLADIARAKGKTDLLVTDHEHRIRAGAFPYGAHFAEVEVDPDTGITQCVKYTVVDDFGVLMNPMIVEGQVHGGVAQGLGQAMCEHVVYDESGQLLTGTFMDYAMPRAYDMPGIAFHTELIPTTTNEIGMKGCGEAGTVGAMAAVTNAALDAVWAEGVHRVDMPLTPLRMWGWLQDAAPKMAAE